jgi:hypothetical protein
LNHGVKTPTTASTAASGMSQPAGGAFSSSWFAPIGGGGGTGDDGGPEGGIEGGGCGGMLVTAVLWSFGWSP